MIKAKKIIEIINKNKVVQAANADIDEQAKVLNQKIAFEEDLKSPILVKIENLSKEFKIKNKVKTVLSNINLTIRQNDKIALLGVNGAGKTTFLEIISGVQSKTSGYISYGYDYNETPYEIVKTKINIEGIKSLYIELDDTNYHKANFIGASIYDGKKAYYFDLPSLLLNSDLLKNITATFDNKKNIV